MVTKVVTKEITETRNLPRSSNDKNALFVLFSDNKLSNVLNFFVSEIFAMLT